MDDILSLDFSPNGNILATASRDRTVILWRIDIPKTALRKGRLPETLEIIPFKTLNKHTNPVNAVSFSPNGKILASASSDRTVKLWGVTKGNLLTTLKGHNKSIWSVNFSPNGKIIASASDDLTVKLWNINGTELKTLEGHENFVYDAIFSPDGKIMASAGSEGRIKLWHLDSKQLQTLEVDRLLVRSCRWLDNYLKTNSTINREQNLCSGVNK